MSQKRIEEVLGIQHSPVTIKAVKWVRLLERDGEEPTQANLRSTREREEPVKIPRAYVKGKPTSHDFRIREITRVRAHSEH